MWTIHSIYSIPSPLPAVTTYSIAFIFSVYALRALPDAAVAGRSTPFHYTHLLQFCQRYPFGPHLGTTFRYDTAWLPHTLLMPAAATTPFTAPATPYTTDLAAHRLWRYAFHMVAYTTYHLHTRDVPTFYRIAIHIPCYTLPYCYALPAWVPYYISRSGYLPFTRCPPFGFVVRMPALPFILDVVLVRLCTRSGLPPIQNVFAGFPCCHTGSIAAFWVVTWDYLPVTPPAYLPSTPTARPPTTT